MERSEVIKITNNFLIEEIEVEENVLTEEAKLKEDLGIDSLDFVDVVVIVEREFGFKIKPEEMAEVKTLGDFYNYIMTKVN
ncbi:MAG TPA: phosphopantetheine-binding protein [Bacteroidales bacterium]|jgi:acyl carrier protein|nr:phosphopantetheine-binding protein [Bacteroidales bacterium]HPS70698.1 phosphopantetheine-binding protein [Bacteroidales bacterium]